MPELYEKKVHENFLANLKKMDASVSLKNSIRGRSAANQSVRLDPNKKQAVVSTTR